MKRLLIFAKYPRAGEVKTRLVPPLTYPQAAGLYRAFLLDAVEGYRGIGVDAVVYMARGRRGEGAKGRSGEGAMGRSGDGEGGEVEEIRRLLVHDTTPAQPGCQHSSRHREPELAVRWQRGHTLGERMENAFAEAFLDGYKMACVIGTDHPTLPVEYVRRAFQAMEENDVAIGPAEDGGYYLLCMKRLHHDLFRDMEFSTPTVFEETMRRAANDGLTVAVLPTWYDVDDEASLRRLWEDREMLPENSRTRAVVADIEWFNNRQ